jgi:hypothetical protein
MAAPLFPVQLHWLSPPRPPHHGPAAVVSLLPNHLKQSNHLDALMLVFVSISIDKHH